MIVTPILCMALNVYHEARSGTTAEMIDINKVVIARSLNTNDDYCKVIFKKGQFSWTSQFRFRKSFKTTKDFLDYYKISDKQSWYTSVGTSYMTSVTNINNKVTYYHDKSIKQFSWNKKGIVKVAYVTPNFVFYKTI